MVYIKRKRKVKVMKKNCIFLLQQTKVLLLSSGKLQQYEQEAFESHKRFINSLTYPGAIRAATPGDTRFYMGSVETILNGNERHYWRTVVDDPQVEYLIPLRVRFKTNVWVTTGWEQRMHIIQVMTPVNITIADLIDRLRIENQSPYLAELPFTLSLNGVELDNSKNLSFYNINESSEIDAIEASDLSFTKESPRPKDWNVDELTADDLSSSPYKEMGMQPQPQLTPRYEGKPKGYLGMNNYSGMKQ